MKITPWKICLCVLMLCVLMVSVVSAASLEERKTELREKTVATLDKLYERQPSARNAIEQAAGYAVFNNTGYKLGLFGSSHGRGMAVNQRTGQEVFMRMQEYQAGLGLGIKEYAVIFVFSTEEAWTDFVQKGWNFGAQATAAANDGANGGSLEGAVQVAPGVWVYQMTTKGLAAELAVKGTNYYRDKDFDKKDKK